MKSRKTNILLGVIAINLTLLSLVQLEIWPTKAKANHLNITSPTISQGNYQGFSSAWHNSTINENYNYKYLINTHTGQMWVMKMGSKRWERWANGPY